MCCCGFVGCDDERPYTTPTTFIALTRDFAPYRDWPSAYLGNEPIPEHGPDGSAKHGYVNRPSAPGATAYPVGTIIVKVVEAGEDPLYWPAFGMAKRGGDFNGEGARDWEFFVLAFAENGAPLPLARGSNPPEALVGNHGYGDGQDAITCNRCHAAEGTQAHDYILSPALWPGVF